MHKDPDVQEEAQKMIVRSQSYNSRSGGNSHSDEERYVIEIYGMTKHYRTNYIKGKDTYAVKNLWLGIQKGNHN